MIHDTSVVDEDVDALPFSEHVLHSCIDLVLGGDVAFQGQERIAALVLLRGDVERGDFGTVLFQELYGCEANAVRAACYDCDLFSNVSRLSSWHLMIGATSLASGIKCHSCSQISNLLLKEVKHSRSSTMHRYLSTENGLDAYVSG